ncbi:MAG: hypothetical protein IJ852_00830 [Alphaproteobacteria bacterium]|nr:hypothetical protein [Alphaproteobacteria bacterium]
MNTKTNLFNRGLRPECDADTQSFLSAVYKSGTQAKKRQADAPQYGRSMIEMLGVLAIIGVITVGSITGYNKAMEYHLFNIQREQLHTLFSATSRYIDQLRMIDREKYPSGQYPLIYALDALGEIPHGMIRGTLTEKTRPIYDVFGTEIQIYYHTTRYLGYIFALDDTEHSFHICKNIINVAKSYGLEINSIYFRNDTPTGSVWSYGIAELAGKTLKNVTISKINQACRFCAEKKCLMYLTMK